MGKKFYMTKEQTEEEKKLAAQARAKEMEKTITATSSNQRDEHNNTLTYNNSLYDIEELNGLEFTGLSVVVAPFKIETVAPNGWYIGKKENWEDPDTGRTKSQETPVPYQRRGIVKSIGTDVNLEDFNKNRKNKLKIGSVVHFKERALSPEAIFTPEKRYKTSHNIDQTALYLNVNINSIECIEKEQPYKEIETI